MRGKPWQPLIVPLQLLWLCLLVERVGLVALCLQARLCALWPAAFSDLCKSRLEAVAVAWALVLPPTFLSAWRLACAGSAWLGGVGALVPAFLSLLP